VFAKEVATLSLLAPGRLTVGVAGGARPQDHEAAGVSWDERGQLVDASLEALMALREPDEHPHSLGPAPHPDIEILVGGASKGAIRRMLRFGHGFIGGGINAEFTGYDILSIKGAWQGAGKPGTPRIVAGSWYASDACADQALAWRTTYLERGGPPPFVLGPIGTGAEGVREMVAAYAEAGADEVVLLPCVSDPEELHWLADVLADHLQPR
jgi:alkanesulfonate monooxygenase SsuD/methylene tetrahydromethanopterin reductase-like flavin-dependent oxidoreductase (luciferase family)